MSVVVLSGGVGGAKLVDGLLRILPPGELTAIVNTGDDFIHLGLQISPDIDSVLYLLSGKSDAVRGWGVADESWAFMQALKDWGGPQWFNLGDRDLAMHVMRTAALSAGQRLTDFTAEVVAQAGLVMALLPMSEDPVRTILDTDAGTLAFQNYFVEHQCRPVVRTISFTGAEQARPTPEVLAALSDPALEAVIVAPSNPFLSVDPILAIPGICQALARTSAPVVAVSPIVGGTAVKGPTAKLMAELGIEVSHKSIANHYSTFLTGLLVDEGAAELQKHFTKVAVAETSTMMRNPADRERVARAAMELVKSIA